MERRCWPRLGFCCPGQRSMLGHILGLHPSSSCIQLGSGGGGGGAGVKLARSVYKSDVCIFAVSELEAAGVAFLGQVIAWSPSDGLPVLRGGEASQAEGCWLWPRALLVVEDVM